MGRAFLADVAELVDALDLGSSIFDVGVRFPPSVQKKVTERPPFFVVEFRLELVYETELHSCVDVQTQLVLVELCGITCDLRLAHVSKLETSAHSLD